MRTHVAFTSSLAIALLVAPGCTLDDSGAADAGGWMGTHDAGSAGLDGTLDDGDDASVPDDATRPSNDAAPSSDAATDAPREGDATAVVDGGPGDAALDADSSTDAAEGTDATTADSGDAGQGDEGGEGGPDASTTPTLLGAWNFDEGTGTSSADLSGNGHPAVFAGGASWGTGKHGSGLALDGASGYADVGVTLVDTTQSFSVLAWATFASVGPWEVAVGEDDVNGSLFGLKLRGDGTNQFDFDVETSDIMNPGFVVAQSTSTAQAGAWVHLAGVYDASGNGGTGALKLYVDGALQANANVGQTLLSASGHLLLGRGLYNGATGSFLHGTLDEVAVYGGALSDAQIGAIYTAQK